MSYYTNRQEYTLMLFDKVYENLFNRIQGHVEDVYMRSKLKELKVFYNWDIEYKSFFDIQIADELKRRHIDILYLPIHFLMPRYSYMMMAARYLNMVTGSYNHIEIDPNRRLHLCKMANGMPPYPAPGSIKIIEDTIVVQLGIKGNGYCNPLNTELMPRYYLHPGIPNSEYYMKMRGNPF